MGTFMAFIGIMFVMYALIPIWVYILARAAASGMLNSLADFNKEMEE